MLVVGLVVTKCIHDAGVERCIFVGNLERTTRDEESFFLFVTGLSIRDHRVAIVDGVQVVAHRGEHRFVPTSHLPEEDDGSAQHHRQRDKAQGKGDGQGCGKTRYSRRLCGWLAVLAAQTHESWQTLAHRPAKVSVARTTIFAGQGTTSVSTNVAILAREAQCALARVVINTVHTGTRIVTRVTGTLINVDLTTQTLEARAASTH